MENERPSREETLRERLETFMLRRLTRPDRPDEFRDGIVELAGIGPQDRVIDVATAVGGIAFAARKKTPHVVAIDADAERVEIARADPRANGIDFRVMDARETPFEDGAFDVALNVLGLHEMTIDGAREALGEARRIARRMVVTEFGLDEWPLFWSFARYPLALFEPSGFLRFTRYNLRDLIENAGWRIVASEKRFPFVTYVCE